MSISIKLASAVALAFVAVPHAAPAAQLDYTLYTGIEHSDNINLAANRPISQNVFIPGINFTYAQQGSTAQANIAGNLEYRDYLGSRFSNQLQAQLAGKANWTLAPGRLDFAVQDYAGIQPIDRLASNAPNNQQQTNVFAAGPLLHFRLGDALLGQAELRYVNSYAQKSADFNSQRSQASFRLLRNLNPNDQISANIESQRIAFSRNATSSNYKRSELFGRYISKLAHSSLDIVLGWSKLDFDHGATRTISSPLARATLAWLPTQHSTFTIAAAREYSDAAADMLLQPNEIVNGTGRGINIGNAVINSQVYLDQRAELTYAFSSERVNVTVAPMYRKLGYINGSSFNQTGRGGGISLDYRLRPTLTLSAFAAGEKLTYDTLARRDRTVNYGLSLTQQWTPRWSWRVSLIHQQRSSTAPDQGFRENQIYFGVVFKR